MNAKSPHAWVIERSRDVTTVAVDTPLSVEFVEGFSRFIRNTIFKVFFCLSHLWFWLHGGIAKDSLQGDFNFHKPVLDNFGPRPGQQACMAQPLDSGRR